MPHRRRLRLALALTVAAIALSAVVALPGAEPQPPRVFAASPPRLFLPLLRQHVEPLACGKERWDVKTLSDPAAAQVDYTPVVTTVAALRAFTAPKVGDHTPRIAPLELRTFTISATLVGYVREDDRDVHLVVRMPGGAVTETMIVEFPDAGCEGVVDSGKRAEMHRARVALEAACGRAVTSWHGLEGAALLTGVAFFDELHRQRGVAPNGVELHPVIGVKDVQCTRH